MTVPFISQHLQLLLHKHRQQRQELLLQPLPRPLLERLQLQQRQLPGKYLLFYDRSLNMYRKRGSEDALRNFERPGPYIELLRFSYVIFQ